MLDERLKELRESLNDHERGICKLEGSYDFTAAKMESLLHQTRAALLEMKHKRD